MRTTTLLLLMVVTLGACANDTSAGGERDSESASPSTVPGVPDEIAEVMAAAVSQLVAFDHTFGGGPPPFTHYLVQATLDPAAGGGFESSSSPLRSLSATERAAIESALQPFGTVQWIDNPEDFRTEDLRPTVDGAAILGLGEPTIAGDSATAPVSMWCGGTCGTWLTYKVERIDGGWQVTGTDGPIAVS